MTLRFLLCAYIALLPLASVELADVAGKALQPADVAFALLVGALAAGRRWRRPEWTGILATALPVAALASATAASVDPRAGIPDLLRVGYSMTVLVILGHARLDADVRRAGWTAWIATSAAVAALALVGWLAATLGFSTPLGGRPSPQLADGAARAGGVLHPNTLVLYLHLGVMVMLWRLAQGSVARRGSLAALATSLAAVILTVSRSVAGLAASVALLAWRSKLALPSLWAARRALASAAALLVVGAVATSVVAVFPLRRDASVPLGVSWNTDPAAYAVIHAAGRRMIAANPLRGVGPGRFGDAFDDVTSVGERDGCWPPLTRVSDLDPHSTWLGWGGEAGLPALVLWLALHVWLLRRLGFARRDNPLTMGTCAAVALAGLMVSAAWVEVSYLKFVWAFFGLAWAGERAEADPSG